jgi:hypothetical protein
MNPAARLSLALLSSLALSFPALSACLRGEVDLLSASMRYLVAFVLTWAGINAVAYLFESYSAGTTTSVEAPGTDQPLRRADDEPSTAGAS